MNRINIAILKTLLIVSTLIGIAFTYGKFIKGAVYFWGAIAYGFSWPFIGFFVFAAILLIYFWAFWPLLLDD